MNVDNNAYISLDNFDIIDKPLVFICDKEIAEVISILNKKGYKTTSSCGGHNENYLAFHHRNIDINDLENYKNDTNFVVGRIHNNSFEAFSRQEYTRVYIMFENAELLPSIPSFFEKSKNIVEAKVSFEENGINKSDKEIEEDLIKCRTILKDWALQLPYLK